MTITWETPVSMDVDRPLPRAYRSTCERAYVEEHEVASGVWFEVVQIAHSATGATWWSHPRPRFPSLALATAFIERHLRANAPL